MTPLEKAKYLVDKINNQKITIEEWNKCSDYVKNDLKRIALIAVNEIISIKLLWFQKDTKELNYWTEVKEEINKL